MKLDDTHIKMLDLLRQDGRMSVSALAKTLGISRSNAYQRYESLIDAGVITGFTATLNFKAAGLTISALVFVTLDQSRWAEFRDALATVDELEYFAVTTGQHDGMLLVRAASVAAVHQLVAVELAAWPSIRATETVFLMDEQWDRAAIEPGLEKAEQLAFDAGLTDGMTRFVRTRGEGAKAGSGS